MKYIIYVMIIIAFIPITVADEASDLYDMAVAYYKLEESAFDYTDEVNGRDFTIGTGPSNTASGKINDAQDFTESNSEYLETADHSSWDISEPFVSLWVYPPSDTGLSQFIDLGSYDGVWKGCFYTIKGNNYQEMYCSDGGGNYDYNTNSYAITYGSWNHLVWFFEDGDPGLCINGNCDTSPETDDISTIGYTAGSTHFMIGDTNIYSNFYDGIIDEVYVGDLSVAHGSSTQDLVDFLYASGSPDSDQQYDFGGSTPEVDIQLNISNIDPSSNTNYTLNEWNTYNAQVCCNGTSNCTSILAYLDPKEITYTSNSKTICSYGTCNANIYPYNKYTNTPEGWIPTIDLIRITRHQDDLILHYDHPSGEKNITLQAGVYTKQQNYFTMSEIKQMYPGVEFHTYLNTRQDRKKYSLLITGIPPNVQNNLEYITLTYVDHAGFDMSQVTEQGVVHKVRGLFDMNYQDIIDSGMTVSYNAMQNTVLIGNISITNNSIYIDPTITPESELGDGYTYYTDASWNTAHDAGASEVSSTTQTSLATHSYLNSGTYYLIRSFIPFDTSAIPTSATITNADIYFYAYTSSNLYGLPTVGVSKSYRPNASVLTTDDHDECGDAVNNPTEGGDRTLITGHGKWYTISLNSTGINWIDKNGISDFCLRSGFDMDDITPVDNTNEISLSIYAQDNGASVPYINITYEESNATKSGLVPTSADSPFWTNVSNPYNITSLNTGTCTNVIWYVNATGTVNTTHEFYAYAQLESDTSINDTTLPTIDITIIDTAGEEDSCTCTDSTDWDVDWTDNCILTSACSPTNVSCTGAAGTLSIKAELNATDFGCWPAANQIMYIYTSPRGVINIG